MTDTEIAALVSHLRKMAKSDYLTDAEQRYLNEAAAAIERLTAERDEAMKSLQELYDTQLAKYMQQYKDERDQLRARVRELERDAALSEAVASAASKFMVAFASDVSFFDEEDELAEVLKPWRIRRASIAEGGK